MRNEDIRFEQVIQDPGGPIQFQKFQVAENEKRVPNDRPTMTYQPKPLIWIITASYLDGVPAQRQLREAAPHAEVKLYTKEDDIRFWCKLNVYPQLIVSDGTSRVPEGEAYESIEYDPRKKFADERNIPVHPLDSVDSLVQAFLNREIIL